MLDIITIVAPVFGIILLGFATTRVRYVDPGAGRMIAEFAFKVAMPALLFRATLGLGQLPDVSVGLIAAYFGALAIAWLVASLATPLLLRRPAIDSAAIAMASCFSNSVMLGVPLAISAFGKEAAAPAALLISLDTPVMWVWATLQMEAMRREAGGSALKALSGVVLDLLRNPIVMSLVLGTAGRLAGLVLPPIVDRWLELLASAAIPAALFALGCSLARFEIKGQRGTLAVIMTVKLLLFPLLVYALARHVIELPAVWTAVAVLFAAMPVGANAFLFASKYERAVNSVSGSIAISTLIAVFTLTGLLYALRSGLL